jgi:hypothetical protein
MRTAVLPRKKLFLLGIILRIAEFEFTALQIYIEPASALTTFRASRRFSAVVYPYPVYC